MGVEVTVKDMGGVAMLGRIDAIPQSMTIGVHEDADPYPDGTDVATVAAAHEFGTESIPERSFLRGWLSSGGESVIANEGERQIGAVVDGNDPKSITVVIGAASVKGITDRMDSGIDPPLAPATLANPDRDPAGTPLLDTRRLRDSITTEPVT
jgi:hypothetical protein